MRIEHIDDVLPFVKGRRDFVVAERDGYVVIDYVYETPETFAEPARKECRGIKFCSRSGRVLARPFAKFHNLGQTEDLQPHLIDFSRPHVIMTKLDGSMIHPMVLDGDVVFCTRMGRTEVALNAEGRHLTPHLKDWIRDCLEAGYTPIMEWTSPDNRIVLEYRQCKLTLLALRHTINGTFFDEPGALRVNAYRAGLDAVETHPSWKGSALDFMRMVEPLRDTEGFVVRFTDGQMIKVKAADYVRIHKAKDGIRLEKNLIDLILSNRIDDVLPNLDQAERERVESFASRLNDGLSKTADLVLELVETGKNLDQKAFAVEHLKDQSSLIRNLAFKVRKGCDARESVACLVASKLGSQADVDEMRSLHGASWSTSSTEVG